MNDEPADFRITGGPALRSKLEDGDGQARILFLLAHHANMESDLPTLPNRLFGVLASL